MPDRLRRELKKRKPFDCLEQEAALSLLRTSDLLQVRFARLFRGHGLTPSQYNILRILRGEGKPLPILEIASRTITVVPGITGLVDRLESAGFLTRRRCEQDRRVIYAELTTQGQEVLAKLDQPLLDLHRQLLGHLGKTDLTHLIQLLEQARSAMTEEVDNA